MSSATFQYADEPDIVRLIPGDSASLVCTGWVNVGPFAVYIDYVIGVGLVVEIPPRGNEGVRGLTRASYPTAACLDAGGRDPLDSKES